MTGLEQMATWFFGIFCASVTACSVAKTLAGRPQRGELFPPKSWIKETER